MRTSILAVVQALRDGGFTVGLAQNRASHTSSVAYTPPYLVVYPLDRDYPEELGGSLADPWDTEDVGFQVTCTAVGPEQATDMVDDVTTVLLAAGLGVRPAGGGGVTRDDTTGATALWIGTPRFEIAG